MLPTLERSRRCTGSILSLSLLAVLPGLGVAGCSPQGVEEILGDVRDSTSPPAGAAVPFEEFSDDVGTHAAAETRVLIRTAQGYQDYFGHAPPAGVDLGRQWVIFYAAGTKSAGGYDANVLSLTRADKSLIAVTELVSPGTDCIVMQAVTAPHVLVKFPAQTGATIQFNKRDRIQDCGGTASACAAILCGPGTHCVVEDVVCVRAPCPPIATCVPNGPAVHCGGIAAFPCPGAGQCVDDPSDSCDPNAGGADCGGICQCVFSGACVAGTVPDTSPAVCACVPAMPPAQGVHCGGIAGIPCPGAGTCVDDPSDSCDPNAGGADCGGICRCNAAAISCVAGSMLDTSPAVCSCVPAAPPPKDPCAAVRCMAGTHCVAQQVQCITTPCPPIAECVPDAPVVHCGGIAGIACPGGGRCADDPSDSCDPSAGGADCGGICSCVQTVACVRGAVFDSSPKVCACVSTKPPTCGPVCDIFCQYGNVLDAAGCPTCRCNPAPKG